MQKSILGYGSFNVVASADTETSSSYVEWIGTLHPQVLDSLSKTDHSSQESINKKSITLRFPFDAFKSEPRCKVLYEAINTVMLISLGSDATLQFGFGIA